MLQHSRRNFTKVYKNYINGKWVESKATTHMPVTCPLTQETLGMVPQSTKAEFDEAVQNNKETFETWKKVPLP